MNDFQTQWMKNAEEYSLLIKQLDDLITPHYFNGGSKGAHLDWNGICCIDCDKPSPDNLETELGQIWNFLKEEFPIRTERFVLCKTGILKLSPHRIAKPKRHQ